MVNDDIALLGNPVKADELIERVLEGLETPIVKGGLMLLMLEKLQSP